jgi:hypothetical protein
VESSCEFGIEPYGSMKCWYRSVQFHIVSSLGCVWISVLLWEMQFVNITLMASLEV